MITKLGQLTVSMVVAVAATSAAAQDNNDPTMTVPLIGILTPATGEALQVEGTIRVTARLVTDSDGTRKVLYSYVSSGTAVGQTSQATYQISGSGEDEAVVDLPLPVDAGFGTSFKVTRDETDHGFSVVLQASLDEEGKVSALVLRSVIPKP